MDNNDLGHSSGKHSDARHRLAKDGQPHQAQARLGAGRHPRKPPRRGIALCAAVLWASVSGAETPVRIATFSTELHRGGPGLLLRDIAKGNDPQVEAVAQIIATVQPDILVLQGVDYDHENLAASALRDRIGNYGWDMAHVFSHMPNTGLAIGLDMDGDDRTGHARDAQGYGEFLGQGGMAILSRYAVLEHEVQDFSTLLWRDIPDALLPVTEAGPFPSQEAQDVQRLSSVAHWIVPVSIDNHALNLMTFHATPPVFDGPEDRNGRRNHDEILFWQMVLDGEIGHLPPGPFVLAGNANLDPVDGEGRKSAITTLLSDPRLQDPEPRRLGNPRQAADHTGDPRLDTAAWPGPDPGHLRVSYILPSASLRVTDSGVFWPETGPMAERVGAASRHRLVWVDLIV